MHDCTAVGADATMLIEKAHQCVVEDDDGILMRCDQGQTPQPLHPATKGGHGASAATALRNAHQRARVHVAYSLSVTSLLLFASHVTKFWLSHGSALACSFVSVPFLSRSSS